MYGVGERLPFIMKKYLKYLPLLLSLILLLYLNMMPSASSLALSDTFKELFKDNLFIYTHIRKIGHVIEFFILSITTYIAFRNYSLILNVLISLTDQLLKLKIPGRHFDITDIPYDIIGFSIGFLLCICIYKSVTRTKANNQ